METLESKKNDLDLRQAHQLSFSVYIHEGQLIWQRFNVLLVANSIFLAMIGFITSKVLTSGILAISLPIVGIIVCVCWYTMTKRGFASAVQWALEIERIELSLPETLRIFTRRRDRISGQCVNYKLNDREITIKRSWISKSIFSIHRLAYTIIWIFSLLYVVLGIDLLIL